MEQKTKSAEYLKGRCGSCNRDSLFEHAGDQQAVNGVLPLYNCVSCGTTLADKSVNGIPLGRLELFLRSPRVFVSLQTSRAYHSIKDYFSKLKIKTR